LEDDVVGIFIKDAIFNEICTTLDLPEEELSQFSADVLDRFRNPYLEHALMSISLNSTSKYKTRVLPSVLEYIKRKNKNPEHLLFSLSALIAFYKGERGEESFSVKDDQSALDFFATQWAKGDAASVVKATLKNTDLWGTDLTQFEGLEEIVTNNLESIIINGMKATLLAFVK
jgi:tagaturonate reductase